MLIFTSAAGPRIDGWNKSPSGSPQTVLIAPESHSIQPDTWSPNPISAEGTWFGMIENLNENEDQFQLLYHSRPMDTPGPDQFPTGHNTADGLIPLSSSISGQPLPLLRQSQQVGGSITQNDLMEVRPPLCFKCEVSSIQALKQIHVYPAILEDESFNHLLSSVEGVYKACEGFIHCSGVHERLVVVLYLTILGQANACLLSLLKDTRGTRNGTEESESWDTESPARNSKIEMVRRESLRGVMLLAGLEMYIKSYQADWLQESGREAGLKDLTQTLRDCFEPCSI